MPEPSKTLEKCTVSQKLINIVLLQVEPGKENKIANRFVEDGLHVYDGFGRYDLALVDERLDLSLVREFRNKPLDGIIDLDVISAFQWKSGNPDKTPRHNLPILGICCIKLDVRGFKGQSIVLGEQEIAEKINNLELLPPIKVCAYCGLGWHELVCLIESSTIEQLASTVNTLKSCIQNIADITTIPCLDHSITKLKEFDRIAEEVEAVVMIDLIGFNTDLRLFCKKNFGNSGIRAFGIFGYLISYKGQLGKLVKAVLRLRSKMKTIVHSTATLIGHKSEGFNWSAPFDPMPLKIPEGLKKKVDAYPKAQREELEDLLFFQSLFEVTINDYKTRDTFRTLFPFLGKLGELYDMAQESRENGDFDSYCLLMEDFYFALDCIRMSFLQRYSGIQLGNLVGGKSLNTSNIGFSLRVIRAAETIPFYFLREMGLTWSGFCLLSYYDRFYRTPLGVIGFPSTSVCNINEFWQAFHESGHEIYYALVRSGSNLLSGLQRRRDELVDDYREMSMQQGEQADYVEIMNIDGQIDELIEEIFSDVVNLHLGFNDDWKLYLETVWQYVTEKLPIDESSLARLVVLHIRLGSGKDHKTSEVRKSIGEAIVQLSHATKRKIPEEIERSVTNIVLQLHAYDIDSEIVRVVFNACKNDKEVVDIPKLRDTFEKGLVESNVPPTAIIRALLIRPIDDSDYPTRLAALMSLYDLYGRYFLSQSG